MRRAILAGCAFALLCAGNHAFAQATISPPVNNQGPWMFADSTPGAPFVTARLSRDNVQEQYTLELTGADGSSIQSLVPDRTALDRAIYDGDQAVVRQEVIGLARQMRAGQYYDDARVVDHATVRVEADGVHLLWSTGGIFGLFAHHHDKVISNEPFASIFPQFDGEVVRNLRGYFQPGGKFQVLSFPAQGSQDGYTYDVVGLQGGQFYVDTADEKSLFRAVAPAPDPLVQPTYGPFAFLNALSDQPTDANDLLPDFASLRLKVKQGDAVDTYTVKSDGSFRVSYRGPGAPSGCDARDLEGQLTPDERRAVWQAYMNVQAHGAAPPQGPGDKTGPVFSLDSWDASGNEGNDQAQTGGPVQNVTPSLSRLYEALSAAGKRLDASTSTATAPCLPPPPTKGITGALGSGGK